MSSIKFKLVVFLSSLFLFTSSTLVAYAFFTYQRMVVPNHAQPNLVQTDQPPATPDPYRPQNILLLGHGDPEHSGGNVTDTIIVAHINPRLEAIFLVTLPRDIWVGLPLNNDDLYYRKINSAYAIGADDRNYQKKERYTGKAGGINLAKDMVTLVTGLPIDYTIAINFSTFEQAIDSLGNVTVDVPASFVDEYYPIKGEEDNPCDHSPEDIEALTATLSGFLLEQQFPCRYERLEFTKGEQHMDGATALKFVRSRHSTTHGNDFNRSVRQQAVIQAIRNSVTSANGLPKLLPLINQISNSIKTDINLSSLPSLWQDFDDWSEYQLHSINLSTDNVLIEARSSDRQYILQPASGADDWSSIHSYLKDQISQSSETNTP